MVVKRWKIQKSTRSLLILKQNPSQTLIWSETRSQLIRNTLKRLVNSMKMSLWSTVKWDWNCLAKWISLLSSPIWTRWAKSTTTTPQICSLCLWTNSILTTNTYPLTALWSTGIGFLLLAKRSSSCSKAARLSCTTPLRINAILFKEPQTPQGVSQVHFSWAKVKRALSSIFAPNSAKTGLQSTPGIAGILAQTFSKHLIRTAKCFSVLRLISSWIRLVNVKAGISIFYSMRRKKSKKT